MKKTLFSAALAAAFGLVAMQASASDGQINFVGKITDASCTVTGGGAATGTGNITVTLPTVSVGSLPSGQTAGDTPFTLTFADNGNGKCANGTKVSLNFDSAATPTGFSSTMVNSSTGNLKNNTGAGFAQNVEVGLVNGVSGATINMYNSANSPQGTIASGSATIPYTARYVANGTVTSGNVSTAVMYSVVYN